MNNTKHYYSPKQLEARRVGEKMWRIPRASLAVFVLKTSGLDVRKEDIDEYV